MQAVLVVASRVQLGLQRRDPRRALTASFSVFPALNVGDVDAEIETASPVLGLCPVRAGLLLVPKVPNPAIRTSSPLTIGHRSHGGEVVRGGGISFGASGAGNAGRA